jgi:hypothetical protein
MVSSIKSTMDPSNFKYSEMQELDVTAIINSEILKQTLLVGLHSILSLKSRTRSAASHAHQKSKLSGNNYGSSTIKRKVVRCSLLLRM